MGLELDINKTRYFIEFKVMYNYKINPIYNSLLKHNIDHSKSKLKSSFCFR